MTPQAVLKADLTLVSPSTEVQDSTDLVVKMVVKNLVNSGKNW
jgi:hypothetical protein